MIKCQQSVRAVWHQAALLENIKHFSSFTISAFFLGNVVCGQKIQPTGLVFRGHVHLKRHHFFNWVTASAVIEQPALTVLMKCTLCLTRTVCSDTGNPWCIWNWQDQTVIISICLITVSNITMKPQKKASQPQLLYAQWWTIFPDMHQLYEC